jgi:glucokinase
MAASRALLAGDVGGTNIRIAYFTEEGGRLLQGWSARYAVGEFPGIRQVLERFLLEALEAGELRPVAAAAFGCAGTVRDGRLVASNIPWQIDAATLAEPLGLPSAVVLNDLAANGLGIEELSPSDFAVLNEGAEDPGGNAVLISPGTGLGESILVREGRGFRPIPSEGGNASFAPRGAEEVALLEWLGAEFGHVSCERILSGPGLANLYSFERSRSREPEPRWLRERIDEAGDAAPVVSEAALSGSDPVCQRTLERFASILGGEAGNLALKGLATGGVFVGGGIAPKIVPKLRDGSFFASFCDKGRLGPVLSRMPVKVVLDDRCALLGAARAGVRSLLCDLENHRVET